MTKLKMTKWTTILTLATLMLISCRKIQPAGFWAAFDKDEQIEQVNNQGPWGGHRAIYWTSKKQGTFDTQRIIEFATKNG